MDCVSVIVPVYHGKRYIEKLIHQVETAAERIQKKSRTVELILVNDAPDESLNEKEYYSDSVKLVVLDTHINRGIHGARVWGLSHAKGEYVVFLDQDDVMKEDFLNDQLSNIGNADAIVCRLINADKLQYTNSYRFEEVITKKFMLNHWNPIVSPGQVLIRKSALSNIWKENILINNGADDYFLWLCMMAEERKFVLNQSVLFERKVTGVNTSGNTNLMMDSECEMIQILLKHHIFSDEDEKCLQKLPNSLRREHVRELDTYRNAYSVYDGWINQVLNKYNPIDFFHGAGVKTVSIYGASYIGKSIFKLLKNSDIEVVFYIDRNAQYIDLEIPVYTVDDAPQNIGGIILSVFNDVESIKDSLKAKFSCPIYTIREIIQ